MKSRIVLLYLIIFQSWALISQSKPINYLALSKDFVEAIKNKEKTDLYEQSWASSNLTEISRQVQTDKQKLAFWVNIYNGFIQVILTKNPEKYQDRGTFFKEKQINIGGQLFSFEDIEHGILRRSQHPLFLGYITRWFPDKTEKMFRVEKRDWRIHFALNCGAKSCPPVAIYDYERLDQQFDISTNRYLEKFSNYNGSAKVAFVTSLFSWFRGDFGGIEGIKGILIKNSIIPDKNVKLKTAQYDWTLDLGNFVDI